MRLNGDISFMSEEEKENERGVLQQQQKLVVGYALTSKKVKSFLQPKLEGLASMVGRLRLCLEESGTWHGWHSMPEWEVKKGPALGRKERVADLQGCSWKEAGAHRLEP